MDMEKPPEILLDKDGHEPWPNTISPARARSMNPKDWIDAKTQIVIGRSDYFTKKIHLLKTKKENMDKFV